MKKTLLSLSLMLASSCWAGEWRALLIGANHFQDPNIPELYGAENDVDALNRALNIPAKQKTVLRGNAATYDTIKNWWEKTIASTGEGDIIFFSIASHGSKEVEHFAGTEAEGARLDEADIYDDYDENFVLPKYSDKGANSRERIVDNELLAWAKRATDKGAYVFIVADVCYGGGGTRSGESGTRYDDLEAVARNADQIILKPELETQRGTRADAQLRVIDKGAFHNRLFYAIPHLDETKVVLEMNLDGERHGLLSYLLTDVFSGKARVHGKPVRTAADIANYLKAQSKALGFGNQIPLLIGVNQENHQFVLIPEKSHSAPAAKPSKPAAKPTKPTADYLIYVENGEKLTESSKLFAATSNKNQAAYRWDRQQGKMIKTGVGVVGYDIKTVADLRNFLLQQYSVSEILKLPIPRFDGVIVPESQQDLHHFPVTVFEDNTEVMFYLEWPQNAENFVVINIPSHGGVQLVGYSPEINVRRLRPLKQYDHYNVVLGPTNITSPFGQDTLLFITFKNDQWRKDPYIAKLLRERSSDTTDQLLEFLRTLPKGEAQMAVVPFSTAP